MTIVITGTSRGIGAGLARAYRARGDKVVGTSRGTGAEIQLDVTQPSGHRAMAATLGERAVELLVCNAGVYLDKGDTLETGFGPDLWAQTFAANVTGVFLSIQALLPHLRRAKAPRIAIVSSQMGSDERAGGKSYIYRSSKAAVLNVGRNLAIDLKPEGIAVGIYHPGWVQTDMGTAGADIDVATSVAGLVDRFDALGLQNTGCFETWDGQTMPM